jgi:hypothetical protein
VHIVGDRVRPRTLPAQPKLAVPELGTGLPVRPVPPVPVPTALEPAVPGQVEQHLADSRKCWGVA